MSVDDLHKAAERGDVAEVRRLVATGVDVDGVDANKITALHFAAGNGHVEALKTLLQLSANIQAKTAAQGATPLHMAAAHGHEEALKTLLQLSANIQRRMMMERRRCT